MSDEFEQLIIDEPIWIMPFDLETIFNVVLRPAVGCNIADDIYIVNGVECVWIQTSTTSALQMASKEWYVNYKEEERKLAELVKYGYIREAQ